MNKVQDISVVVCAYTEARWHDLVACIESLKHQTQPLREIIVVIDHNPALFERVRSQIADVVVIENSQKQGLSGARNSALAVAKGVIVAFIDEDATAAPDWATQLNDQYSNPGVLGVGGAIRPVWLANRPRWFPDEYDWVVGCTYRGMPETTMPVRNLIGCNMSFRREVFDAIGGFREEIGRVGTRPLGCEETELCIRLGHEWSHAKLLYVPTAEVYHRVPAIRGTWGYFRARCFHEGLSKALISRFVGSRDSLASEWTYLLRTLTRGVARGIGDTFRRRDLGGVKRSAAIIAGLAFTTGGYIVGKLRDRQMNRDDYAQDRVSNAMASR